MISPQNCGDEEEGAIRKYFPSVPAGLIFPELCLGAQSQQCRWTKRKRKEKAGNILWTSDVSRIGFRNWDPEPIRNYVWHLLLHICVAKHPPRARSTKPNLISQTPKGRLELWGRTITTSRKIRVLSILKALHVNYVWLTHWSARVLHRAGSGPDHPFPTTGRGWATPWQIGPFFGGGIIIPQSQEKI